MERRKKKNKLVIPPLLEAFIEKEFQSMLKTQKELEEQRKTIWPKLKKKEQRESKRAKRVQRENPKPIYYTQFATLKGKDNPYLNIFVYQCYYLLHKENEETIEQGKLHKKDIHEWISDFLSKKEFKKDKGNPYTTNDIRKIINYHFEDTFNETGYSLKLVCSFVDNMFEEFCDPISWRKDVEVDREKYKAYRKKVIYET